jgi:hypothetical protein
MHLFVKNANAMCVSIAIAKRTIYHIKKSFERRLRKRRSRKGVPKRAKTRKRKKRSSRKKLNTMGNGQTLVDTRTIVGGLVLAENPFPLRPYQ